MVKVSQIFGKNNIPESYIVHIPNLMLTDFISQFRLEHLIAKKNYSFSYLTFVLNHIDF